MKVKNEMKIQHQHEDQKRKTSLKPHWRFSQAKYHH